MMFSNMGCYGYIKHDHPTLVQTDNIDYISVQNSICEDLYVSKGLFSIDKHHDQQWDKDTILHAHFNGSLFAGNVDYALSMLSAIRIKRRESGYNSWITLFEIKDITDISQINVSFKDITPGAKDYDYALVPIINNVEGQYVIQSIRPSFEGIFIVGQNKIFNTRININNVSELTTQYAFNTASVMPIDSRTPYVFHNGLNKYESGTLSATYIQYIPEQHDFDYTHSWQYRNELKEMLSDGKPKLLKNSNGQIWLVDITSNISDQAMGHPDNIITTFSWVEVGNVNSSTDLYASGFIASDYEGS